MLYSSARIRTQNDWSRVSSVTYYTTEKSDEKESNLRNLGPRPSDIPLADRQLNPAFSEPRRAFFRLNIDFTVSKPMSSKRAVQFAFFKFWHLFLRFIRKLITRYTFCLIKMYKWKHLKGVEPSPQPWQGRVLAVILQVHKILGWVELNHRVTN